MNSDVLSQLEADGQILTFDIPDEALERAAAAEPARQHPVEVVGAVWLSDYVEIKRFGANPTHVVGDLNGDDTKRRRYYRR